MKPVVVVKPDLSRPVLETPTMTVKPDIPQPVIIVRPVIDMRNDEGHYAGYDENKVYPQAVQTNITSVPIIW